jgi:uncharacterized protein
VDHRRSSENPGERTYRRTIASQPDWTACGVTYQQTDLWIQADREVRLLAERALLEARIQVEGYARGHHGFLTSHSPLPMDPLAPETVQRMLESGHAAGVGPMAGVAGAIAQFVGERLLEQCREVVVENGGDIYLKAMRPLSVGVFAGESPLSNRMAIRVFPERMPMGIATSAATVGHSWSYGQADAACVMADNAALADAAATALCNRVRVASNMEPALAWALGIPGVRGALVILDRSLAVKGEVELQPL